MRHARPAAMTDWLSSTWEANWRPFQYFNLYRLILGSLALLGSFLPQEWTASLHLANTPGLVTLSLFYLAWVMVGLGLSIHWQHRFNLQLSLQVSADVLLVGLFMYTAGGVSSGLGVLLLVSLAAASLVGRGRLVLFYAAQATLVVLCQQIFGMLYREVEPTSIVQAGILSAGFFATAILARLLGQRVMVNEELARRRGIALANQERISQRIIERMQDGVLVVGADGLVQRHNPVADAMLGALPENARRQLDEYSPALATALSGWLSGRGGDALEFVGADGDWLRGRFASTESSDGEVLIFLEDMGRIQERAQQLKLASLGRLTASIAHEIRNPLSAIGHAAELLREERRNDIQERLLRIVGDNVGRLDRIVQDILELGRSDRAQPERLVLAEFCTQFAESLVVAHAIDPAVLQVDCPAGLCLYFDRAHLHQVLWNLLGNAVRHSRQLPGSVRLRACVCEGRVELHVLDDGPGVPEAVREQIFEPFFTTHHQGTGLGLFIARELCEANGAALELGAADEGGHFIVVGRSDS